MIWCKITDTMPPCNKTVVVRFCDGSIATAERGIWDCPATWMTVGTIPGGFAFGTSQITHYADVPETPTEW